MQTSGSEITYLMFWIVDCVGYQLSLNYVSVETGLLSEIRWRAQTSQKSGPQAGGVEGFARTPFWPPKDFMHCLTVRFECPTV